MKLLFTIVSYICLTLSTLFSTFTSAQESYLIDGIVFQEKTIGFKENDKISFLINSTGFNYSKPTAIYFNGSLPMPLIIEWGNGSLGMIPFTYFHFNKFIDNFNLILVSKPFTPIYAKEESIINSKYVPDLNQPDLIDSNFSKLNNLTYLGKRGDYLINWLLEENEINPERIMTIGHSQGGLEAARVASLNKNVSDVVMLGAAPYGRAQHVLNNYYLKYLLKEIDFETYTNFQKEVYKYIYKTKDQNEKINESILSFEEHAFIDMMQTKANVLYMAGTKDIASFYVDQVVVDAILNGKKNIQGKLIENAEHSFFRVDRLGSVNYEVDYWDEVFNYITIWFNTSH